MMRYFSPLVRHWHLRSSREQWMLGVLAGVAIICVWWTWIYSPIQSARIAAVDRISTIETLRIEFAKLPDGARLPASSGNMAASQDTIAAAAAARNLSISRINAGSGRIDIALENAAFNSLIGWLVSLSVEQSVTISNIEISRRPEPGTVSATIVLELP